MEPNVNHLFIIMYYCPAYFTYLHLPKKTNKAVSIRNCIAINKAFPGLKMRQNYI